MLLGRKKVATGNILAQTRGWSAIMVFAAIGWRGKTQLIVVTGKIDQVAYVKMLQGHLEPFIKEHYPRVCVFQQDNAPAHSTKFAKEYFMEAKITTMEWPARSPDLNCIENAWGELARRLYAGARQFDTVDDLQEALFYEWEKLDLSYIQTLIKSMPCRADQCHERRGRHTDY